MSGSGISEMLLGQRTKTVLSPEGVVLSHAGFIVMVYLDRASPGQSMHPVLVVRTDDNKLVTYYLSAVEMESGEFTSFASPPRGAEG